MDGIAIRTERFELPLFELSLIEALLDEPSTVSALSVPAGWPDLDGRAHLERWHRLATADRGASPWRARAVVDHDRQLVGHVGFHGPPMPIERALDDPTFSGRVDPCAGGAVEIGYTVFPGARSNGVATEAAQGLLDWARSTGDVGAVLACVRPSNQRSLAVLARLGGFELIGRCRDDEHDELVLRRDLG